MKKTFYTELAYICGLIALAIGTALMEKADFGVSMIVAPAYLLYMKLSQIWDFFTFGMAEYILQFTLMLLLVVIMRKMRLSYLLSFVTALIYGVLLDGAMLMFGFIQADLFLVRVFLYILGLLCCVFAIALLFHTYISPEVYELFVKEISEKYGFKLYRFKTVYDCVSCIAAIIMSFIFFGFGRFEGIGVGTVLCAFVNGWLIGCCTKFLEKYWEFKDATGMRKYYGK